MQLGEQASLEQLLAAAEEFVTQTGDLEVCRAACGRMRELIVQLREVTHAPRPCGSTDGECDEALAALLASI